MTACNRKHSDPAAVLAAVTHVLLDFDGPVCRMFAGYPAPTIAAALRGVVSDHGITLPEPMRKAGAHDLLRYVGTISLEIARHVETALATAMSCVR